MSEPSVSAPEGWYNDGSGRQRYWDGKAWTIYAPDPPAPAVLVAPLTPPAAPASRTANRMPVSYTRQQEGHSLIGMICIDWITLYTRTIYYSVSPNHYWRL